jgi:hypothetical protein
MSDQKPAVRRRAVLQTAAGLALAPAVLRITAEAAAPETPDGRPGDFDFLTGEWKISHRRLKAPGEWDVFEGEATCWSIIGGVGHVEELRIPARDFSGTGLRFLDLGTKVWSDYWVNAKSGALGAAGLTGRFEDGVGLFTAEDVDAEGKPIRVRGVWDQITGRSHRWRQGVSRDGGASWEDNWFMDWVKA